MNDREAWTQVRNLGALKLDIRKQCRWVGAGLTRTMKPSDEQRDSLRDINGRIDQLLQAIYPSRKER